jgi:hypothetical protein
MIYLKYASTSESFAELSYYSKPTRSNVSGVTMRGNLYDHTLHARRVYTIVISADAITTDARYNFLEAYHISNDKYISFNGSDWTSVVGVAGDMAIEAIEGIRSMPEVTITLQTRAGSTARITAEEII